MAERFDLVIRGASVLVDGVFRPAEIGIADGLIAAILPDRPAGAEHLDGTQRLDGAEHRNGTEHMDGTEIVTLAPDEVLIPGLVDTHVHVNEPGRTEWEGFASASRAAAAGGVTTIIDMPLNSIPPTISVEALDQKRSAARRSIVDVGFWGGAVPGNLGSLRALHDAGVFGFKAFLAPSGVDEFQHLDPGQLETALEEVASIGAVLIVHAEDPGVLTTHANAGGRDYHRFVQSRPDEAETTAIERVIAGVRRTGARAHILHLSSAAALPALRAARREGLPITVETCPHYLTLSEDTIPDGATQFKCCPPIRNDANRDALWQALTDGDIDIVVTDHSPSTRELKLAGDGDFQAAWGGIAGLQLGLPAVWTAAARRGIPLASVLGWMSRGPADLVGLADRGRIAVGTRADLVAFSPDVTFVVDERELLHRNPVSAYHGIRLRGVVRGTWLAGLPLTTGPDATRAGRLLSRPSRVATE